MKPLVVYLIPVRISDKNEVDRDFALALRN